MVNICVAQAYYGGALTLRCTVNRKGIVENFFTHEPAKPVDIRQTLTWVSSFALLSYFASNARWTRVSFRSLWARVSIKTFWTRFRLKCLDCRRKIVPLTRFSAQTIYFCLAAPLLCFSVFAWLLSALVWSFVSCSEAMSCRPLTPDVPGRPCGPGRPCMPFSPAGPGKPSKPGSPFSPALPNEPGWPGSPFCPLVSTVGPGGPRSPFSPLGPIKPGGPGIPKFVGELVLVPGHLCLPSSLGIQKDPQGQGDPDSLILPSVQ
ncbi:hypothetical protein B566_EDAN001409 [Ephemera danica]|nr:hypothetical protein B566_EDAN001409 [Ephemera danica]